MIVCGISTGFPVLFPTPGQITHVLLTRAPLYSGDCSPFLARLACVRHAASVDSEPGSNSQDNLIRLTLIALKTELTRKILRLYVFYFSKNRMALRPQIWREKNRLDLLGGAFNEPYPATNLSLGTSLNYRYRADCCQAPILIFLSTMRFVDASGMATHLLPAYARRPMTSRAYKPRQARISADLPLDGLQQLFHQPIVLGRVVTLNHDAQQRFGSGISDNQSSTIL